MEKVWTMRNGENIKISDMEDSHLMNTIRMVERNVSAIRMHQMTIAFRFAPTGEFASEGVADYLLSQEMKSDSDVLNGHQKYVDLTDEAKRRNLI